MCVCVCVCQECVWGGGGSGRECEINAQSNQVKKITCRFKKLQRECMVIEKKYSFAKTD